MLLTDVSVVQSACSSLCTEVYVFISLISSVTFTFSITRGNIPSYGLVLVSARDAQGLNSLATGAGQAQRAVERGRA